MDIAVNPKKREGEKREVDVKTEWKGKLESKGGNEQGLEEAVRDCGRS